MSTKLTRRTFLQQVGLVGAGLALASCAPAAAPGEGGAPSKYKKTDLIVPSWWAPHEIEGAEKAFQTTFKEQTGLNVKYEFIGSDFHAKVFTNLASGAPYDVITFNADSVPQYLEKGVLLPLDDLIARDKYDTTNFFPNVLEQWNHDGKLYGLSNDLGSFHCYFNKDLFKKAGLEAPKPTDDWTWDQLAEWSKQLTVKEGDQTTQYGFAATGAQWCWELFPNQNGAFVFDEAMTKSLLDDLAAIQGFEFYQKLMYEDNSTLRPGATKVGPNELFLAGQLAILIDGTWQVGWLRSKKDEVKFAWDVGVPPHNVSATKHFVPNFTAGWVIPKTAQDIDASWEATKFYASDTFAKDVMFVNLSGLPTTKSALEGAWFAQWPENPPEGLTKEFYAKLVEQGASRRHLKFALGSEINASLEKLGLIYSNEQKPADLLPGLAEEITKELADRPWNK